MALFSKLDLQILIEEDNEPCVSIFMPTHRAGVEVQQDPIRLKNLLGEAQESLITKGLRSSEARDLLKPLQELTLLQSFREHRSDGLAIFVSQEVYHHYRLPLRFEELVVVADRFHIKPLLPLLSGDGQFYILALSQNEIRLLQGTRYSVGQVELENVPQSLANALRWDDPERHLQFRSGTGTVERGGRRSAVFHGHGGVGSDDAKENILRYFHQVDEGMADMLQDGRAPLVLAGVNYLLPLYREANSYPHVLDEGIAGNPEELSQEELRKQAWAIVEPYFQRGQKEAAARYRELASTGSELASSELREIVPASYNGQVAVLFIAIDRYQWGTFDPDTSEIQLHEEPKPGDEDLLDLAALRTLLHGGTVYAIPLREIPGGTAVAALFRY